MLTVSPLLMRYSSDELLDAAGERSSFTHVNVPLRAQAVSKSAARKVIPTARARAARGFDLAGPFARKDDGDGLQNQIEILS